MACAFAIQSLFKNQGNKDFNTSHNSSQVGRQGSTVVGRIIAITQIDAGDESISYEFLVQKGNTNNVISVVQTNELGLKPGDNVVLVTIDGTTRIRSKM